MPNKVAKITNGFGSFPSDFNRHTVRTDIDNIFVKSRAVTIRV
jgi:hypothetical protein